LPTARHHCNLKVWTLLQGCGDGLCSFVTPERLFQK